MEVLANWKSIVLSDTLRLPEELSKEFLLEKMETLL